MRLIKRGRTWFAIFYESGRRVQRTTKCHDRHAAEAVARQFERDASNPRHAAARSATLSLALQLLIEHRKEKAAAGRGSEFTVTFYENKAGHLVRVFETDEQGQYRPFLLKSLSAEVVDKYISRRRSEGAGENSISKELVTLRAALRIALRKGIWDGNIAAIIPVAFAPEYRPRNRFLAPDELKRLLEQLAADRSARVAFIVATSANWRETDLARREDVGEGLGFVLVRGTKRQSRFRTVPIASKFSRELLAYTLMHAEGSNGMLFRPWTNVRRDLIDACERAGLERCSPNDLRRTFAVWLRSAGVTPDLIAPAMGHVDTRMVERVYGRLSPQVLGERIAAALGPENCNTSATLSSDSAAPSALIGQNGAANRAKEVPRAGIEPATRGFSVLCSTD